MKNKSPQEQARAALEAKKKGAGGKLNRSETVTVRLDPKMRWLAEIAARKQRRTLSSYIEWAIQGAVEEIGAPTSNEAAKEALFMLDQRKWGYWIGEVDDVTKNRVTRTICAALEAFGRDDTSACDSADRAYYEMVASKKP